MAPSKIRKAHKKARHEAGRKVAQTTARRVGRANRLRQRRMHKMFDEGRREHQQRRKQDINYIDQLKEELGGE